MMDEAAQNLLAVIRLLRRWEARAQANAQAGAEADPKSKTCQQGDVRSE